jgi:pimeloyl-ACP methyl ester carboxylesterase
VHVELVKTVTSDGLRLDGSYHWGGPLDDSSLENNSTPTQVIVLHGAGSNFYAGGLFEQLTPALVQRGIRVLRVNTRGHDGYYTGRSTRGVTRLGAAYESVSDCRLDVAAWLSWLRKRQGSSEPTVLVGHSLGAIKAIFSQAEEPSPDVVGILAISPPRLSYSAFQWGAKAGEFAALLREAKKRVADGAGDSIMESTFPFPMLISAHAFLDKYGGETYNVEQLARQVTQPVHFLFGERELQEGGVAFAGLPESLLEQRRSDQTLRVDIVEGADHFYIGCQESLRRQVELAWKTFSPGGGEERQSVRGSPPDG